jgi:predicted restriction endonuclease
VPRSANPVKQTKSARQRPRGPPFHPKHALGCTLTHTLFRLSVWKQGDQRAPHKPLLVLYALGRWQRGLTEVTFREAEPDLKALLQEFGPPRKSDHPEQPFWRLQRDGVWNVRAPSRLPLKTGDTIPRVNALRSPEVRAGFSGDVQAALGDDPGLVASIGSRILEQHFPESVHQDILDAVGLTLETTVTRRKRDPEFRRRVLNAYEYRCAVCGFDVRLGSISIALDAVHIGVDPTVVSPGATWSEHAERSRVRSLSRFDGLFTEDAFRKELPGRCRSNAGSRQLQRVHSTGEMSKAARSATKWPLVTRLLGLPHIRWHQAGGPDEETNGLALCVLHHKTFDLGAFTVSEGMVLVSDRAHGTSGFHEVLMAYHGGLVREPQRPDWRPEPKHLAWHGREVFKGEPRHRG